jgi:acyl phosphate:glycerol-3-phosphate acyltransferase
MPLASVVIAVAAYLLGSIPTGYLLVRLFRHQDIRAVGSGNIGATNVLRTGSKGLGAATFGLDVLKGCAAVWLGTFIWTSMYFVAYVFPSRPYRESQALAALFCVLGHMFPVWLRFKGGKGVATGFGVFLVASPLAALAAIAVFFVVLAVSRYVSLASIVAAACFPLFAWITMRHEHPPAFFIAVEIAISLLIILKHHQNIARLFAGTEHRFGARQPA